jgi:hypothetical protein
MRVTVQYCVIIATAVERHYEKHWETPIMILMIRERNQKEYKHKHNTHLPNSECLGRGNIVLHHWINCVFHSSLLWWYFCHKIFSRHQYFVAMSSNMTVCSVISSVASCLAIDSPFSEAVVSVGRHIICDDTQMTHTNTSRMKERRKRKRPTQESSWVNGRENHRNQSSLPKNLEHAYFAKERRRQTWLSFPLLVSLHLVSSLNTQEEKTPRREKGSLWITRMMCTPHAARNQLMMEDLVSLSWSSFIIAFLFEYTASSNQVFLFMSCKKMILMLASTMVSSSSKILWFAVYFSR